MNKLTIKEAKTRAVNMSKQRTFRDMIIYVYKRIDNNEYGVYTTYMSSLTHLYIQAYKNGKIAN